MNTALNTATFASDSDLEDSHAEAIKSAHSALESSITAAADVEDKSKYSNLYETVKATLSGIETRLAAEKTRIAKAQKETDIAAALTTLTTATSELNTLSATAKGSVLAKARENDGKTSLIASRGSSATAKAAAEAVANAANELNAGITKVKNAIATAQAWVD